MYDRGLLRSHPLGARTVSVGNITAGGTGKTPLAALTARILADNGNKVCILTRGYGRSNEGERVLVSDGESVLVDAAIGGDEPVELAKNLLGKAVVVADADRVAAARWAKERFGVTAFVLDDAFQHRRARRDLDIVCIDATNPCGNGMVLPAGVLREPLKGLRRADAIVVTRSNLVDSIDELTVRLHTLNPQAIVLASEIRLRAITELHDFTDGDRTPDEHSARESTALPLVFTGIGNPDNFRKIIRLEGFRAAGFRFFPDHHRYTQSDIDALEKEAGRLGARSLLTTAKDAVKLTGLRIALPVFVAESEAVIDDEETYIGLITGRWETGG